ncbi:hypothetical protein [Neptuniibacter sp. QD37_11]|uniref:hypothetical protein n=1 Tax=Neptuniibacter sp. QD37_11 TaxID=3398209 RepID=UPI0039F4CD94
MSLITDIITTAKAQGMSQKTLCLRTGVPESTLSRAKKSGNCDLKTIERLLSGINSKVSITPDDSYADKMNSDNPFGLEFKL